jgi:AcrR family transcriptional regulator
MRNVIANAFGKQLRKHSPAQAQTLAWMTAATDAGVGAGTLYRPFPTRDALIEAVYRGEVEKLAAAERNFAEAMPPVEALRAWMLLFVDYMAAKQIIRPHTEHVRRRPLETVRRFPCSDPATSVSRRRFQRGIQPWLAAKRQEICRYPHHRFAPSQVALRLMRKNFGNRVQKVTAKLRRQELALRDIVRSNCARGRTFLDLRIWNGCGWDSPLSRRACRFQPAC